MEAVRGGDTGRSSRAVVVLRTALAVSALGMGGVVGCGDDDDGNGGGASPASLRSQLLPPSEVPGSKTERKFEWDNPIDFAVQGFHLPESTPPSQAVEAFEKAGFEAGVGATFVAAKGPPFQGPHTSVSVVQLGSDDDAGEALDYVRKEALKQPCFAVCSVDAREFAVTGIPGAKGVQLTPQRNPPANAPPPFAAFSIAFTAGPRLYLVNVDGEPGQVDKGQALRAAKALYKRSANGGGAS